MPPRHVLILADIEGSSGCRDRAGSAWLTRAWIEACAAMTDDVAAVATALFGAGVPRVTVQDFHRTGFNLFRERLPPRLGVLQGYRPGPVPGIGHAPDADAVMMIGMHAASGTPGFLPHTLTSSIRRITLGGAPLAEVQLFSAALADRGTRPLFFSGCPEACAQARAAIPAIETFPIAVDERTPARSPAWRRGLAKAAATALAGYQTAQVYDPPGPITVELSWRGGPEASAALARKWGLTAEHGNITLTAPRLVDVYHRLVCLCYLEPWQAASLPLALRAYRAAGRQGLAGARRWFAG